jgi:hypothetical protein
MARARNIKPATMTNEQLAELEPLTRLLFIYLWMLADREGRLEDRPKRIAAEALAYDRAADVGAMLDDLQRAGFIARYVAGGKACIQVLSFAKHQTPHIREAASDLPPMGQGTTKAVPEHDLGKDETSPRSPDSGFRIPDSGLGTAAVAALPAKVGKKPIPPDFGISERVREWAKRKGYGQLEDHLEAFKRKCAANDYRKASFDDSFMEAIREDWAKLRGRGQNGAAPPAEVQRPVGTFKAEPPMTLEQLTKNAEQARLAKERLGLPA